MCSSPPLPNKVVQPQTQIQIQAQAQAQAQARVNGGSIPDYSKLANFTYTFIALVSFLL